MSEETKKETEAAQPSAAAPSSKKTKKKWPMVVGIVAVVLVVAGIGGWIWHEQPSFCGTVCHYPMAGYLESYDSQPNSEATDAYGNEVSNSNAMLAVTHKSAGLTCLDCHESNIGQQVSEGVTWISGNYYVPLDERSLSDLTSAVGNNDSDSFCLKSGCHDSLGISTRDDLVKSTSYMTRNPHDQSQHGELECSDCHKAHRASTISCSECHTDSAGELPDGWITATESEDYMSSYSVD